MEYLFLLTSIIMVALIFVTYVTTATVPLWMLIVGGIFAMGLLFADGTSSSSMEFMEDDDD